MKTSSKNEVEQNKRDLLPDLLRKSNKNVGELEGNDKRAEGGLSHIFKEEDNNLVKIEELMNNSNYSTLEDVAEYGGISCYEIGCMGLVSKPCEIGSKTKRKKPLQRELSNRQLHLDLIMAKILSDLHLLHKFKKQGSGDYILFKKSARKKQVFYPY